ncbi:Oidioi.mRNA.OKI2018_I69.chr2.g7941.t1.cds [Oikopleura dioica]|uniref:Oidioi.mRNA.OKI2018_I69.chr2.g7941.t1.cds n=1 Tax=Oikopleura dioica TaxID=34765 RepID=A0ABN7TB83_OIKDI|nr:Oidioi.mRNA.OKI2018_I69.chr2.g7941.t1.cds [Oikopleura dioica]
MHEMQSANDAQKSALETRIRGLEEELEKDGEKHSLLEEELKKEILEMKDNERKQTNEISDLKTKLEEKSQEKSDFLMKLVKSESKSRRVLSLINDQLRELNSKSDNQTAELQQLRKQLEELKTENQTLAGFYHSERKVF